MKNIINIEQATKDIELLTNKFKELAEEWESWDGDPYICSKIAIQELSIVKQIALNYQGFIFEYKESEYTNTEYDEWYENETFTKKDFELNNIDENNYGKADAVAFDMKCELVSYIQAEIIHQTPKIQLIGLLCEIERFQTILELFDEEKANAECDLDNFVINDITYIKEMIIDKLKR